MQGVLSKSKSFCQACRGPVRATRFLFSPQPPFPAKARGLHTSIVRSQHQPFAKNQSGAYFRWNPSSRPRMPDLSSLKSPYCGLAQVANNSDKFSRGSLTRNNDTQTHRAFIAMGSNVGDRLQMIEKACLALEDEGDIRLLRTSCLYETEPMYVEDQARFLNGACEVCRRRSERSK